MDSEDENDKLRTYKLIKPTFGLEKYLDMLSDRKQPLRKSLTAFRISAHTLQIECGRCICKKLERKDCVILVRILKMNFIY